MRLIENSNTRKVYSSLVKESDEFLLNKDDKDFRETVIRDFIIYLEDRYGVETLEDMERVKQNVTDEDVNDYFTGLFYDIFDNDDLDTANEAEEIIRSEFHVSDTSNEEDEDLEIENESVKTQDTINQLDADNTAKRLAGITGNGDMTLDQYDKYQEYMRDIRKKDTSRYDITISYWDRDGYPKEKSYIGRSLKDIAKKFVSARDKVYSYKEISDYSDNLDYLMGETAFTDMEEFLDFIAKGGNIEEYKLTEAEKIIRYNVFVNDTPVAQDVSSFEDAKKIADENKATVITKYSWNNEDDYQSNKEADKVEDMYLTEAEKPKKEDKRVVMQQGNVTCIKENETYLVFENEADNEVEHDSEESAMQDFMERVGIDTENELKEE